MKAFEENSEKSFPVRGEGVYQSQFTTEEVGSDQNWIAID